MHIKAILLFAAFFLKSICPAQVPRDSFRHVLEKMPADTGQISYCYQLANLMNGQDLEFALEIGKKGLLLAGKLDSPAWIARMQMATGRTFANLSQPDSALWYFEQSKAGFEKLGNWEGVAGVLSKLRWVQNFLGNFEAATNYAFESLSVYEGLNDTQGVAIAHTYIGEAMAAQGKYDEATHYGKKGYAIQKRLEFWDDLGYTAQNLADAFLLKGEYSIALDYASESLNIRQEHGSPLDQALSLNARANVLKHLNRYEEALQDYKKAMQIARNAGFPGLEMATISNSADVFNRMGRYQEALPMHLKMEKMIVQTGEMYKAVENFRLIAEAYAGLGRFDSAYFYQKKHTILGDSLHTEAANARVSELQTQYETAQKEALIQAQQQQISRQNTLQWLSLGGGGLLLIIALLLAKAYRTKQSHNLQLQKKNREIQLLVQEIHHRVKNNLQIISSLLNLQAGSIKDPTALDAVREGKSRVESMGLIHQRLYATEDISRVFMPEYLEELGMTLFDTFGVDQSRIAIQMHVDPIKLDVDASIPLGLIINELITNSLKHGFPEPRSGSIVLTFREKPDGHYFLSVRDDGIGKPGAAMNASPGFGSKLVQMLCNQLKGQIKESIREDGTEVQLWFPKSGD